MRPQALRLPCTARTHAQPFCCSPPGGAQDARQLLPLLRHDRLVSLGPGLAPQLPDGWPGPCANCIRPIPLLVLPAGAQVGRPAAKPAAARDPTCSPLRPPLGDAAHHHPRQHRQKRGARESVQLLVHWVCLHRSAVGGGAERAAVEKEHQRGASAQHSPHRALITASPAPPPRPASPACGHSPAEPAAAACRPLPASPPCRPNWRLHPQHCDPPASQVTSSADRKNR